MADKTSFIFVAHEGKKRANAPANESKRIRSELQRRTWQERRLKSAQRLRESATVPTTITTVSRACRHAGLTDHQPAEPASRLRAKTVVCPLCGQKIDVRAAPSLQSLVDDGNLDPFDSSVVTMTKHMQKVLRIGELVLIALFSFLPIEAWINKGLTLSHQRSKMLLENTGLRPTRTLPNRSVQFDLILTTRPLSLLPWRLDLSSRIPCRRLREWSLSDQATRQIRRDTLC